MTVEQQRAAEAFEEDPELLLDRAMVRPMRLLDPLLELGRADGAAPQIAMLLGSSRNDPKSAAGAGRDSSAPRAIDNGRVDLVLGAVAVDRGARRPGNHGAAAALLGSPHQPVDEWILERDQRCLARRSHGEQPIGVVTARVRH